MAFRFKYITLLFAISLPALALVSSVSTNKQVQLLSNQVINSSDSGQCDLVSAKKISDSGLPGLNPEKISLLNWNIYKGNGDNWQQDLSRFAKDHDVMTIQEAKLDESLSGLLAAFQLDWVMNAAFHLNGVAAGVMTVSSSNAVFSCGFKTLEPLIRIPKSTLISYYAIRGSDKKLLVANIHGINFTPGITVYHQQLSELYDAIKLHDGPMIVAGDFNSWSDDRLDEVNKLIEKLSLSALEYSINNKTHLFGKAIDHVFYRQLEPVSNKVWQVSSSDHNPISVNFRLRSEKL